MHVALVSRVNELEVVVDVSFKVKLMVKDKLISKHTWPPGTDVLHCEPHVS